MTSNDLGKFLRLQVPTVHKWYAQNGRYRQQVKPTCIAHCLPLSATYADRCLPNGQLAARRIGFALVAVAQQ
jgi:hypothetical protein